MSVGVSPVVSRVLGLLDGVKVDGGGWVARCPAHDDRTPSLSVGEGDGGRALINCYAGCDVGAVLSAIGLQTKDLFASRNGNGRRTPEIVATYNYVDEAGEVRFQVARLFPKSFRQRHPCPQGREGWTWGLGGNLSGKGPG